MKYLLKATNLYYGLSIAELKIFAYQYVKNIGIVYPSSWDDNGRASPDWYYAFMHRHKKLSLRTPEQISANRAKAFSKENVDAFFTLLGTVFDETHFEPHRIWNMDETGCATVPTKTTKVIAEKGARRVGTKTSAERGTTVTMALAINATGQSIPPFYIFPRKNMQRVFMNNASPGSIGVATESGWMTAVEFVKYMEHFIKHTNASKESPILLVLDNHTSHLSVEVIDMAIDHGITMISFPPHCSHRMQPLDVGVFGPFKKMFYAQCTAWMKNHIGRVLELYHIAPIADKCLDLTATPRNIKKAFEDTGIFPYNPNKFTAEDFIASELSGENLCSDSDDDTVHNKRVIISADVVNTAAHEEITTSPSEINSTSAGSSRASIRSALKEVGPLKFDPAPIKSKRGRKPMKSTILTSPDNVQIVHDKANKKRKSLEKKKQNIENGPPSKRTRRTKTVPATKTPSGSSDEEDVDFCIICMRNMPTKLNRNNAIHCNECDRAVHLKCANMKTGYFTCSQCEAAETD